MGDSLPFFPCDFITVVERVERLMGKIPFQFLRGGVEQDKPLDREFVAQPFDLAFLENGPVMCERPPAEPLGHAASCPPSRTSKIVSWPASAWASSRALPLSLVPALGLRKYRTSRPSFFLLIALIDASSPMIRETF